MAHSHSQDHLPLQLQHRALRLHNLDMPPWLTIQQRPPHQSPLHIVRRHHHRPMPATALVLGKLHRTIIMSLPHSMAIPCRHHSHRNPRLVLINQAHLLAV